MIHVADDIYINANDQEFQIIRWDGKMVLNKNTGIESKAIKDTLHFSDFKSMLNKINIILARTSVSASSTLEELNLRFRKNTEIIKDLAEKLGLDNK